MTLGRMQRFPSLTRSESELMRPRDANESTLHPHLGTALEPTA